MVIVAVPEDASPCTQKPGKPKPNLPCPGGTVPVICAAPCVVPFGSVAVPTSNTLLGSLLVIVTVSGELGATSSDPVPSACKFRPRLKFDRLICPWPRPVPDTGRPCGE